MRRRAAGSGILALLALVPAAGAQLAPLLPAPAVNDAVLRRADWLPLEPLSLEDLLRTLVGIDIARTGGVGSPEVLQLAGSQNGRVQLLLDGVPVAEPELEWPRLQGLQVSNIDSIEVSRATDPARLAIWTRHGERGAPYVDLDLGRGDLGTRTRRVQFFTPPRRVDAAITYEELLRRDDDFRTRTGLEALATTGAYSGRGVTVRVGMHHSGDHLRLEYQSFEDESWGSAAAQLDLLRTRMARTGLRWQHQVAGADLCLDVGQRSWKWRTLQQGIAGRMSEARTHAALEARLPSAGPWSTWVRLRYPAAAGDRAAPESLGVDVGTSGAEVQAHRDGRVRCDVRTAVHHDSRLGAEWSAAAQATMRRGSWDWVAQAGRGISFPGWGETAAPVRRGVDAALRAVWRRGSAELRASVLAKQFRGGSSAAVLLPAAGSGPTSLGSAWVEAAWRPTSGAWQATLAGAGGWTPYQRGNPSGLSSTQARLDLRGGRSFRGGDLVLTLLAGAWLEGSHEFADGATVAPAAVVDLGLNTLLIRRADFFLSCRNVTDARAEVSPGVAVTPRWWHFGVRVRLLD